MTRSGVFIALLIVLIHDTFALGMDLYFIDAHSQVDHRIIPLDTIVTIMKKGGVSHTILSARGKLKGKAILSLASKYPDQITPAIRTKGKYYQTDSAEYYKNIERQVTSGKFQAMAEILLYHAKKGNIAPEYEVYPQDDRVRAALNYAVENQWPFVVHIEFGSLRGEKHKQFMEQLEKMLRLYPEHPFVLAHLGQLGTGDCRRLLEIHKNLHFHTAWTNPAAIEISNQPWVNIFDGKRIAPEWSDLFIQYPNRFIFALDNVFAKHWTTSLYEKQMAYWKEGLAELPIGVAHLIAHGNAERLWNIAPRD